MIDMFGETIKLDLQIYVMSTPRLDYVHLSMDFLLDLKWLHTSNIRTYYAYAYKVSTLQWI